MTNTEETIPRHAPTGRLAEIGERVSRVEEKLDQVLALSQQITALTARVVSLEIEVASEKARTKAWQTVGSLVWALGLAIIGAGVWMG